ncbi:DUF7408 domain-containing protein [Effusibacillus pohliae]|uniref:DUF7408 domain-containing protein n=1 Tax=Effusibacillus pohliae TaxID=232270 RepID=UPI00036B59D2|nr:hypothetical protein [Effusibacillus pohliae]
MKIRKRNFRRFAGALLTVSLLAGAPGEVWAEQAVHMQVQVGWDGTYKPDAWTSVQVTIDNSGKDFSGRVIVKPKYDGGNLIAGQFEKEVVVPQGSSKKFRLDVPGALIASQMEVRLLDVAGKEVESTSSVPTAAVQQGALIGGITANKDDLAFFSLLTAPSVGGKVTIQQLNPEELPDRSELLNGLDLLVVNHAPKEKLTNEQIQAIAKWVEKGGCLLVSGGPNYTGGGSLFGDLSPVQVTGTTEISDLSGLRSFTGAQPPAGKLTVTVGQLKPDSQVLIHTGNLPLVVKRQIGAGSVLYAAYDLSEEPLASWQGNKDLWGKAFAAINLNAQGGSIQGKGLIRPPGFEDKSRLVFASTLFNALTPSMTMNIVLFGSYVLIVGPLMFFVLRRVKKREWGWFLIPGTAAVFALGIYLINTDQRSGGAVGQFVSMIDLKTERTAKLEGAGSFVVTRGGDYTVQLAQRVQATVVRPMGSMRTVDGRVLLNGDKTKIVYDNVEYWSTRSTYVDGTLQDKGAVKSDLHVDKAGKLVGTLANNTKFDLENVFLLVGKTPIQLNDIKQGETVKIDEQLPTGPSTGVPFPQNLIEKLFPWKPTPFGPDKHQQYRDLLEYATFNWKLGQSPVQLFAFTRTPLDLYSIENVRIKENHYLSLVRQDLSLNYDQGKAVPGLIRPKAIDTEGQVLQQPDGFVLENSGSITFQYDVKLAPNFSVEKVTTDFDQTIFDSYEKQLFNWQTNQWEVVKKEDAVSITGDNLKKYVSPNGTLWIKLKSGSSSHKLVPQPGVGVEGKVSP